jgi:molybdenum cofactor guanylyltransferase
MQITGLILAGGRSSRMNGKDKGLLSLLDRPMIAHVIERLQPQVDAILISANRHLEQYQKFGYEVLQDDYDDYRGPLAGMARGLSHSDSDYLLTVPCDGPLLPRDLGQRMLSLAQNNNASAVIAFDGQFKQPTYNLIHKNCLAALNHALENNEHKLGKWLMDQGALKLDCSDQQFAFINVNTPEDLEQLASSLSLSYQGS